MSNPKKVEVCDTLKEVYQRFFGGINRYIQRMETILKSDLSIQSELALNLERIESDTHILAIMADEMRNNQCLYLEQSNTLTRLTFDLLTTAQELRKSSVQRDILKKLEKQFNQYATAFKQELSSSQLDFQLTGQKFVKTGNKLSTLFEQLIPPAERVRVERSREVKHQELMKEWQQLKEKKEKEK